MPAICEKGDVDQKVFMNSTARDLRGDTFNNNTCRDFNVNNNVIN